LGAHRPFDGGVVEPQGNESALLVQRVAQERMKDECRMKNFCLLPSTFYLSLPPVGPRTLRQRAHHRFVPRAVAEEDVVGKVLAAHGRDVMAIV